VFVAEIHKTFVDRSYISWKLIYFIVAYTPVAQPLLGK
jgi:hypothetical protein